MPVLNDILRLARLIANGGLRYRPNNLHKVTAIRNKSGNFAPKNH